MVDLFEKPSLFVLETTILTGLNYFIASVLQARIIKTAQMYGHQGGTGCAMNWEIGVDFWHGLESQMWISWMYILK